MGVILSDLLPTNVYDYKNHAISFNKYVYIPNIMAFLWPLSVSIESMRNILLLRKMASLPSMVILT